MDVLAESRVMLTEDEGNTSVPSRAEETAKICQRYRSEGRYDELLLELSNWVEVLPFELVKDCLLDILYHSWHRIGNGEAATFSDVARGLSTTISLMKSQGEQGGTVSPPICNCLVSLVLDYITLCLYVANDQQTEELKRLTKTFLTNLSPSSASSTSPVNFAIAKWSRSRDDFASSLYTYLAVFLMECGADVNARDLQGNTPLHLVATADHNSQDALRIAQALFRTGVHLDLENGRGLTALESSVAGQVRTLINSFYPLSLSCLTARVIRRQGLREEKALPKILTRFVGDHVYHEHDRD